jgi:hypothetical protein
MTDMSGYNTRRQERTEERIALLKKRMGRRQMYRADIVEMMADVWSERTTVLILQYMRRSEQVQHTGYHGMYYL